MDKILHILCSCLNSFVITAILFQFMNSRYKKIFKRNIYILIETIIVLCIVFINSINNSLLNLAVWFGAVGITVYFLYYEDKDKTLRRILECEALMFCMTVCESLGVIYSESNIQELRRRMEDIKSGTAVLQEHKLIEVE